MKRFTLLIFSLTFLMTSCSDTQKKSKQSEYVIPTLLTRHEFIRNGEEWDDIQNRYAKAVLKIAKDKTDVEQYIKLSEIFVNEARVTGEHGHYYPGALQVLEKALNIKDISQDQKFRTLSLKASVLLSQHEFSNALDIAKEAIVLNKYNAQIYGVLVDAYVELGDYKNAVKMADQMVNIRPDLRSYSRVSYLREIHGDLDGAIEAMLLAVAAGYPSDEQTAWARLTLGKLYEKNNDLESAKQHFELILQERKHYPFAYAALANIYQKMNDADKAESLLIGAMEIIPEVGFYEQMATIYKDQNRTNELAKISKEIFEMLEDDVKNGHNMNLEYAQLYYELLEDPDKALFYAKEEFIKRPENIDVNKMMAFIYHKKSNSKQAQIHADKAMRTGAYYSDLSQVLAVKD